MGEKKLRLFSVYLGGKQIDDKIEAHNLFIGVGESIESLLPAIKKSWRGVKKLHIDSWEIIDQIDGYEVQITPNTAQVKPDLDVFPKLLIVNIGYYIRNINGESHRLLPLLIKNEQDTGISAKLIKLDDNFKKGQAEGEKARSHVDDNHNIAGFAPHEYDIDDSYDVKEQVPEYLFEYVPIEKRNWKINEIKSGFLFAKELAELPDE